MKKKKQVRVQIGISNFLIGMMQRAQGSERREV